MEHSHDLPYANGQEALRDARTYVTKIGGDNAGQLKTNADVMRKRLQDGRTQILAISAIRSSQERYSALAHPDAIDRDAYGNPKKGFNTTSHLIAAAKRLQAGTAHDRAEAEDIAHRVQEFTLTLLRERTQEYDRLASPGNTMHRLERLVTESITDPGNPRSLASIIRRTNPEDLLTIGEDWLSVAPQGTQSITGIGEDLARRITLAHLQERGMAPAPLEIAPRDEQVIFDALRHKAPSLAIERLSAGVHQALRSCIATHRIIVAGGYFPYLGTERGYSDKAGAWLARLAKEFGGRIAYLIEKASSIMSADPKLVKGTRVVPRMTPFLAKELFGNERGADAGAIHPAALDILAAEDIPIVVLNSTVEPTPANTTLISDFSPEPNGVEIIHSKPVSIAIEVQAGAMIGQQGFEEDIARWFASHGVSIQHIATSEGSISYTFDNGKTSEETVRALRAHIAERYGINGERAVRAVRDLSAIYCLGNDMRTPGQMSKATFALEGANVNIPMVTQGLNQAVMTFLAAAGDAPKAVQALHDLFITLPKGTYAEIMGEARRKIAQALAAGRQA